MRMSLLVLLLPFLVCLCSALLAADPKPDPYQRADKARIGPAAVPVMEQVFWVELPLPPAAELRVAAPEGVKLLDKTKPGPRRSFTRLYFRSDRGIRGGAITISPTNGPDIVVPLRVLTYREDIEDKTREVKGLDPAARKRGRSYYTDEMLKVARANAAKYPDLLSALGRSSVFDKMSDAELFAFLPSWNLPRQCYSNWPCPFCGEKIYEKSAFYPWQHDPQRPSFKCICPLCKRKFPTNDIAKDDFTSGDFPDDGWGCDIGAGLRGAYAGWVAYYNHQMMWLHTGGELKRFGERYLLAGDEAAAHKAAVLLARLAYIYAGMDMTWQQVDTRYLRGGRALLDGNWERTGLLVPACQAYDAIFDFVGRDEPLAKFLNAKDPSIKTPDDVKALIETYLIQLFGWDWIARRLSGGNQGARERDLAYMAVCADMGPISDRWIEELFTRAWSGGINKGGYDDQNLINTLNREGPTLVCGFGYSTGYVVSKSDMAEILSRVTSPKWQARCNLYDPSLYPKFRAEFDTWTRMLVAGHHVPGYGDHGSARGQTLPKGAAGILRTEYARAYLRWPTDTLALALFQTGAAVPALFEPDVWPMVAAQAKIAGPAPPLESRVLDGVGFVFLESRPHAPEVRRRAGIALRYGQGLGHQHNDNLNVEMWAHDTAVAPELGYPCWAHPMGATGHTVHHNTGMIDRAPQYTGGVSRGTLEMFSGAPEASFADVSAAPSGFPNRLYRRAVCLADAPGGNVYLFDVLRMAGGARRTYCFHGPAHNAFDTGLRFGPKASAPFEIPGMSRGLANNVVEPQEAASDADVWADWTCDQSDVRLRLDVLGSAGRRYYTARYAKPDSPPIRFFFPEDESKDGASEFVALWQPYVGKPFVEKMERLAVEQGGGRTPDGFGPVAVRVTLAGGQTDVFLYSADPSAPLHCGDFEFQGHFGYWSELNGVVRCVHLVAGRRLMKGGAGIADAPPSFRAKISAVDLSENVVTLDAAVPAGLVAQGQPVFLCGGRHRTAYTIAEVLPSRNRLRLDHNSMLFRSRLEGIAADRSHILVELDPPIEVARGFKPGAYDDAVLTGEDHKARYRVKKVEMQKIFTDRPAEESDFSDSDGDGLRRVFIYDHAEGDEAVVHNSVFVRVAGKTRRVEEGRVEQIGAGHWRGR